MQDRYSTTTVRSYSSGTQGRALVNAGTNHFIIDGPGGEALGAGEAFLSGVVGCAVNLVERQAREAQMPLKWTDVTIQGVRDSQAAPVHENLSVYNTIRMKFELTGLDDDQAQELVAIYQRL
jgi:uncharacterized OsmC-like protein